MPNEKETHGLASDLGVRPDELAAHQAQVADRAAATATPLPGPAAAAFASPPTSVGGWTFRDVVLSDFATLRLIGSPLYHAAATQAAGEPEQPYSIEQLCELIYLFTHPARECRQLATKPDDFRQAALEAVGDELPISQFHQVQEQMLEHFNRAFITVQNYTVKAPEGEGVGFTKPAPPTASAGGSTS